MSAKAFFFHSSHEQLERIVAAVIQFKRFPHERPHLRIGYMNFASGVADGLVSSKRLAGQPALFKLLTHLFINFFAEILDGVLGK